MNEIPMMGMAKKMMENMENFNPMEMCKNMISAVNIASEMAFYASPEIRELFLEWLIIKEKEVLKIVEKEKLIDKKIISQKLKISESAVEFFLTRLAINGKIKGNFEVVEGKFKEDKNENCG